MDSAKQSPYVLKIAQLRRATGDSTMLKDVNSKLGDNSAVGNKSIRSHIHKNIEDTPVDVDLLASRTPTFVEASEMRKSKGSSFDYRKGPS